MMLLTVILTLITLFTLALLIIAVSNLFVFRSLESYGRKTEGSPTVSILVPARNEEETIAPCIESLLSQDYPCYEICVLDDDSRDRTWQILTEIAERDQRLKICKGKPLPPGWMGKQWACHQLALKSSGEFKLFSDADTVHQPLMLKWAMAAMEKENADLITAWPRQDMGSTLEKLVMPFSYWSMFTTLPLSLAYRNQHPILAAGTGQFMLFRGSAYDKIGGFESVKRQVVDDVELCRNIRSKGLRWRILDGNHAYSVRQYRNYNELFEGFGKNLYPGFKSSIFVFVAIWLWLLLISWLPIVTLTLALLTDIISSLSIWLSLISIMFLFATWFMAYSRFRLTMYYTAYYPVSILAMFLIAMRSMFLHLQGKATWKGRNIT